MKYFELLGLPGSGKTTLLRSFRRRHSDRRLVKTVLSEDWVMIFRRIGYRNIELARKIEKRQPWGLGPEMLRNLLLDQWQMGIFDEYPELFARIFECLGTVRSTERQRTVLLNYWRSRTSLYLDLSNQSGASAFVVDEGLSQTVFSLMTRMSAPSNRKLRLVDSVLRSLPSERTVVMIQTPKDLLQSRVRPSQGFSPEDWSRKSDELAFIFQRQKDRGQDTIVLDGSLTVEALSLELGAQIARVSSWPGRQEPIV